MKQITPSTLTAHLAMLGVSIIYGINYFTLKFAFNEGFSNFAALALRAIISTLVFGIFYKVFIKEKIKSAKDYGILALCALFGVTLNQTFYLWGLSITSPLNAGVLMITTPVFVVAVAAVLRLEKTTWRKLVGVAVSFVGAALLITGNADGSLSFGKETLTGDLMIMFNAASYATYLLLVRPLILRYNPFTIVAWIFFFGAMLNIPLGISELVHTDFMAFSYQSWFGIAFLVLGATLTAYFMNAWAMQRVPSSSVGMYIYVQPIFVTVISALFYSGTVSWLKVFYILLILTGVWLATQKAAIKQPA